MTRLPKAQNMADGTAGTRLSIETLLLLAYAIKTHIVGQPGSSSIINRVKLGQTTVQLRKRAGFDDVGHRLGLTTGAQIMSVRRHVFLQTPQCP